MRSEEGVVEVAASCTLGHSGVNEMFLVRFNVSQNKTAI